MENFSLNALEAVLANLDQESVDAAQKSSDAVSEQYKGVGVSDSRLNMIAYDDLV